MRQRTNTFTIDKYRASSRGYLAAYCPVNDPRVPLNRLADYASAQVDVVELGLKSPNPYLDGAVIRESMARCTGAGNLIDALPALAQVQSFDYPALGMVFSYASRALSQHLNDWQSVDGLLCLGKDQRLTSQILQNARAAGTRITKFVPYNLDEIAVQEAISATGYVMLQYLDGPTGIQQQMDPLLAHRLDRLRACGVNRPVLVGIGVSRVDQVKQAMDSGADGVVIGSQTVLLAQKDNDELENYLCKIREVLNGG